MAIRDVKAGLIHHSDRGVQYASYAYTERLQSMGIQIGLVETLSSPSESAEVTRAGSAPSEEISLWTVPYARNPHFTGRDDLLQQLGQLLAAEQPGEAMSIQQAALTQTQAITGLGGIGKTQIGLLGPPEKFTTLSPQHPPGAGRANNAQCIFENVIY